MSMTGLAVFDKTIQTTNIWLRDLGEELDVDRKLSHRVLKAVLHAVRDRMLIDEAAHFAAQLPMLVRGIFYDGWNPNEDIEDILISQ